MADFRIAFTGDFLDETGAVAYGDIGLNRLVSHASVRWGFISDLSPKPSDPGYWARLYSLEVAAEHIRGVNGLVVLRPWVKRSTFAEGAADLVVIGRSGRATTRSTWMPAPSTELPCLTPRWRSTTRPHRRPFCSCLRLQNNCMIKSESHARDVGIARRP